MVVAKEDMFGRINYVWRLSTGILLSSQKFRYPITSSRMYNVIW